MIIKNEIINPYAPPSYDADMYKKHKILNETTNCFAYSVQCEGAGLLSDSFLGYTKLRSIHKDYNYMARAGQSKGFSYDILHSKKLTNTKELSSKREKIMIQALKKEGILFQGKSFPKKMPPKTYLIACFLNPNSYHFLRQNRDGIWTSKDGHQPVTDKAADRVTVLGYNPEKYYNGAENCPFVGYFIVPEGGLKVGLKKYMQKLKINNNDAFIKLNEFNRASNSTRSNLEQGNKGLIPRMRKDLGLLIENANKSFEKIDVKIKEIRSIYRINEIIQKNEEHREKIMNANRKIAIKNDFEIIDELRSLDKQHPFQLRFLLDNIKIARQR